MSNWNPKWNPDRKLAAEEIRRYLLDRVPAFVEACDTARGSAGNPCVTYACDDLICNPSTAALLGWAVLYAFHTNVNFLLLHRGNICCPEDVDETTPEPR